MTATAVGGRPTAKALLVAIILAIALSPRIRVPGLADRAVDFRVQDFLLVPVLLYLATRMPQLRRVWGTWPAIFAYAAVVLTLGHMFVNETMTIFRTAGYLGRVLETFLLAAGIAGLYRLAGDRAWQISLHTLHAGIGANVAWVAFQYATGSQKTLFGSGVGDLIEAYGPKLVGEASAFGTGSFFVLVTALGCAELVAKLTPRWLGAALVASGLVCAYLSQSRVSLVAAALCAVAVFLIPDGRGRHRPFTALFAVIATFLVMPRVPLTGRLSEAGFEDGFGARTGDIWAPLIDIATAHPLFGIGVGNLGTRTYPWTEAHNVVLRAVLDYGIVVGGMFLAAYLTIGWRAGKIILVRGGDPVVRVWATLAALLVVSVFLAGIAQDALVAVMSTHLVMLATGLLAGAQLGPLPDPPAKPGTLEHRILLSQEHAGVLVRGR
jgi:hypothetical protein